MTANRTLDLDKLFVRDIYFKDYSNRPISANKILTTRGDGGIYFGNQFAGETYPAFNELRAGSNTVLPASNVYNTLWFEEGAGITFHTVVDGLQPKTFIASSAPEQITVVKDGGTVNFSSLKESLVGGRTLFYDYTGDATINVSDTTITFGTAYNSSYSSLTVLTSTTISLQENTSTIQGVMRETLSTVDTYLISTTLSTFYSTLVYTTNIAEKTSSFVFSTFNYGPGGATINIGTLNAVSVSTNTITVPTMITTDMNIGSNLFNDMNLIGSNADACTAYLSTGIASTYTNFFKITDSYTNATFAIEKDRIFVQSTFGLSSLQVIGNQVQVGWFPQLSTQSGSLPPSTRENFIPILEQTEIIEKSVEGNASTLTKYVLKNVGKFDEICAKDNLAITAPNVTIKTLTVDVINALNPFKAEFLSTFSTAYISSGFVTNMNVSTVRYSTLRGHNIRSEFVSTTQLSTNAGYIEQLEYNTAYGYMSYDTTVSTVNANFDIARGNGISTTYLSTNELIYSSSIGNSLIVLTAEYSQATGQYLSTQNIGYGNASGSNLYARNASTGTLGFGSASGTNLLATNTSTTTLRFEGATGANLNTTATSTGTLTFGNAKGNVMDVSSINAYFINVINVSSYNVSTVNASFSNLDASTIQGNTITSQTISTIRLSTNAILASTLVLRDADMYQAFISDLSFSSIRGVPFISSFSTFYISTAQIINGAVSSLTVSTIMGVDAPIFTFDMLNRRVGVNLGNTQQPRATMDISGVVYANNFVTTSDRRLKSNIEPLTCSDIPKGYRYIQEENGEMDIGVMADEVERIAPECVYTRPDGYKAVSYMKLVPVCLTLIQSLSDRLAALENDRKL
jgi:hypothetical protein